MPARTAQPPGRCRRAPEAVASLSSGVRAFSCDQQLQVLERAGYRADRLRRDTGVERRRVELGMSQEDLNDPDIDVLLEKMRGKAATQRMGRHALPDGGHVRRLMDGALEL